MKTIFPYLIMGVVWFLNGTSTAQVSLLQNGDFEMGLQHWNVASQGSGDFLPAANGNLLPYSNKPTANHPDGGTTYAVSDQLLISTEVIWQSFEIPASADSMVLTYDFFVNNWHSATHKQAMLSHTIMPNQHYRIDILQPNANPYSTDAIDIVALIADGGNHQTIHPHPWQSATYNLSDVLIPGQSYILRFAVVQNQDIFNLGIDNVSITAFESAAVPIPTMSQWAMIIFGLIMVTLSTVSWYNFSQSKCSCR